MSDIGVGIVGFGYWGPNLARNFDRNSESNVLSICELDPKRAEAARRDYPHSQVTDSYAELLANAEISLIAIATPVSAHYGLAKQALQSGKDVLVEKPFTRTVEEGHELIALAEKHERVLAVDHTFLYTGAVQKMKEIVDCGDLGQVAYIDAVRINLGLFQHDVNVVFDLAPHDISITNFLIDRDPVSVRAIGACHAENGIENIAYLHLEYADNFIAHFHLSWLAPVKIRRFIVGGMSKMIVYDELEQSEKVKVYDKTIVINESDVDTINRISVDYRTGDMVAPKLAYGEALETEAQHIIDCVKARKPPISDGVSALRTVRILEASQKSIKSNGDLVKMEDIPW